MDPTVIRKPKTIAELLPNIGGFLSKDARRTYTDRKQPRPTTAATRTAEKYIKPMSITELKASLSAFKLKTPSRVAPNKAASNKKKWNSSVKVENKTISHTANGQMKHHPVRKALNFQLPKPSAMSTCTSSMTIVSAETPKFPKPTMKAKKSLNPAGLNKVRISGICPMPSSTIKPINSRMTLANKENISTQIFNKKMTATPKSSFKKGVLSQIHDTPLGNVSWQSSCDASFLNNEKNAEEIEALAQEKMLGNITEVTPSMSTPFRQYRKVKEYFNNSSDIMDNSEPCQDDTIMCFDKPQIKRDETVIVSLCDMLHKASVTNPTEKQSTELEDLLEIEQQTVNNIKMIENGIKTLKNIKESQLKSLKHVRKLIKEKHILESDKAKDNDSEVSKEISEVVVNEVKTPKTVGEPCSVIKSCLKSPSYKIPKKNSYCLRKKVYYKSMPNVTIESPVKDMNVKALSMYMEMKEHMNFLRTPVVKKRPELEPNTPAITSYNLQKQLDKLYEN